MKRRPPCGTISGIDNVQSPPSGDAAHELLPGHGVVMVFVCVFEAPRRKWHARRLVPTKYFVLRAIEQDGRALQYADDSMKKRRDFVLKAVEQNRQSPIRVRGILFPGLVSHLVPTGGS